MPFIIEGPDSAPPDLTETPIVVDPPDLLNDLPPFEQDSRDIQGVLTVIGNELARLEAARQELIANYFPGSADALLHFFELMLGLPIDSPAMSLSARQATVLAFMQRLKSSGSGAEWVQAITALIGTGWTFHLHDPADSTSPPPYVLLIRVPYSAAAPVPTGVSAAQSGTGTLDNATYFYAVSSLTAYGETLVSTPAEVTVSGGPAGVEVQWPALSTPVSGYNVYRGADPSLMSFVGSVANGSGTIAFADDGSAIPGISPPGTDTSSSERVVVVEKLARSITPAHLALEVGYTQGFIIGVSDIGIDAL